jgi:hypothetical protein
MLTFDDVDALLTYDPGTGVFRWKIYRNQLAKLGSVAGSKDRGGYMQIRINGVKYLSHRLAHLLMTKEWPTVYIDHINGVRDDNRWDNLRLCNKAQNSGNMRCLTSRNTTGYRGVTKRSNRYVAQINIRGDIRHIGSFNTAEEAYEAYRTVAKSHFGDFFYDPMEA